MNELPVDYFSNNNEVFACKNFGELPAAEGFEKNIRDAIADIQPSHIALGYALIAYAESHTFGFNMGDGYRDCRLESFFGRCNDKFHLEKSTVSRHVNVVYRFGDGKDGLRSSYRDKFFSFLVELLPLSEQEIDYCMIHCCTVADVRAYKKKLSEPVATSQQENTDEAEAQDKPVAISKREEDRYIWPKDFGSYSSRYFRFTGLSVTALCDKVLQLEEEVAELRKQLSEMSGSTTGSHKGVLSPLVGGEVAE